mmetsp:Transcript_90491/g.198246  ORF Transcript_90491/g.198246 Transcript_90491/m.198246 type:complete len:473 (+) Transcript_90491:105-1523(+)
MALPKESSDSRLPEMETCISEGSGSEDPSTADLQRHQRRNKRRCNRCCIPSRALVSALTASILGFLTFSICAGIFMSSGIFITELVKAFKQSAGTAALVASFADITFGLGALPVPFLHRRLGVPVTYVLGASVVVLGVFLTSFAVSAEYFICLHGILVSLGLTICYVTQLQILYIYTPQQRRGLCMAFAASGGGAGAAWMGPALSVSFEQLGLHATLRVFASGLAVCLAVLVTTVCLLYRYGRQFKDSPTSESSRTGLVRHNTSLCHWLCDPQFMTLYVAFAIYTFGASAPPAHLPTYVAEQGVSTPLVGTIISVFGIANGLGRIVFPNVGDCLGGEYLRIFGVTVLANGCSVLALPLCRSTASLFSVAGVLGFSFGGRIGVICLVCCQLFGQEQATKSFSLLTTAFTLTSPFGPPFVGLVHDCIGRYDIGFIVVGMLMVVSSILLGWLDIARTRRMKDFQVEDKDIGDETL